MKCFEYSVYELSRSVTAWCVIFRTVGDYSHVVSENVESFFSSCDVKRMNKTCFPVNEHQDILFTFHASCVDIFEVTVDEITNRQSSGLFVCFQLSIKSSCLYSGLPLRLRRKCHLSGFCSVTCCAVYKTSACDRSAVRY